MAVNTKKKVCFFSQFIIDEVPSAKVNEKGMNAWRCWFWLENALQLPCVHTKLPDFGNSSGLAYTSLTESQGYCGKVFLLRKRKKRTWARKGNHFCSPLLWLVRKCTQTMDVAKGSERQSDALMLVTLLSSPPSCDYWLCWTHKSVAPVRYIYLESVGVALRWWFWSRSSFRNAELKHI